MLGLVILLGLFIWLVLTKIAIVIGAKWGKRLPIKRGRLLGGFLGFMLLMGGFIVYWTWEYIVIQYRVSKLCESEAGLTVYVTPEEWRKQIGEEEWAQQYDDWHNISSKLTYTFNGKIYYGDARLNKRVYYYEAKDTRQDMIGDHDYIYVDNDTGQVLYREHRFHVGVPAIGISLTGLKSWLNEIEDCWDLPPEQRFFHQQYVNEDVKKETNDVK